MFVAIENFRLLKGILNPALFIKIMLFSMLMIHFPYIGDISIYVFRFVCIIWGLFIFIANVKNKKNIFRCRFFGLLLLMACSYGITIVINYKYNLIQNTKALVWFVFYIEIILSWWRVSDKSREGLYKDINQINWIVIIINLFNVIPSVILYVADICIKFEERLIGIYFQDNRLFGVMDGLNPSAMIAFISILAVAMNKKIDDRISLKKKLIYYINIIFSYIYIIASGTRSVRFIMIVMITFYYFIKLWNKWITRRCFRSSTEIVICNVIRMVLIFLVVCSIVEITRYPIGMMHISNIKNSTGNIENIGDSADGRIVTIRDADGESRSSSDRYLIWKECITLWSEHPIFGIGNANMKKYVDLSEKKYVRINRPSLYGTATHSMPIAVLLFSGIVGTVLFGGYLVLRMVTGFLNLLKSAELKYPIKSNMLFSFMVCVSICMYSLLDTAIIFNNVENTILFWIYLSIMESTEDHILRILKVRKEIDNEN